MWYQRAVTFREASQDKEEVPNFSVSMFWINETNDYTIEKFNIKYSECFYLSQRCFDHLNKQQNIHLVGLVQLIKIEATLTCLQGLGEMPWQPIYTGNVL